MVGEENRVQRKLKHRQPQPNNMPTTVNTVPKISVRHVAIAISVVLALGGGLFALLAIPSPSNSVTLAWTAPGDDGNTGQASSYDIRYSLVKITPQTFEIETAVGQPPRPQSAGRSEQYIVKNLLPDTEYFFALKSADEKGNTSIMSNVVSKKTAKSTLPLPKPSTGAAAGGAALAMAIIVVIVFRSR